MSLLKRIFAEHRSIALPLALALLVNLGAYALVVYPLAARAAGAQDRASAAARTLDTAARDEAAARALVTSKSHAEQELTTFYGKVIAPNFPAARGMTHTRLPALARTASVRYLGGHFDVEGNRTNPRVGRLKIHMVLQGEYEGLRRFIYELESAPEFVIIDDVTLAQGDEAKPLTLTVDLSAYYRMGANGI